MKKSFYKGIALFISVLMVLSGFSVAFPMAAFAEDGSLNFGDEIHDIYDNLTNDGFTVTGNTTDKASIVEEIYDELSGVEYTAVYGSFAGDVAAGIEENYTDENRAKVYNNLMYSPMVSENTAENPCAALWDDATLYKAGNYIRYYYPTTVMVYDGKTAPKTAVSMGVKAGEANYITPYSGYVANASDGIVFGNTYWRGFTSSDNIESPLFLQPYFDYTESMLTTDGTENADMRYRHEGASAYYWTNNLTFKGSFAEDEFYKVIRPEFCWKGGNNYEEGLTTLTAGPANKSIYVINIVPFERVLEEARYIGSAIMLKPDEFTDEYVESFVERASAIIAAKPSNFISADTAEADIPQQVESYANALQSAISAWDSWQQEDSTSISNSQYYVRMKYRVTDSWNNANGEYKVYFDYKPFNGKGPTQSYCVTMAESCCDKEGEQWILGNSTSGVAIPGFVVGVRVYAKIGFSRSFLFEQGILQISGDGKIWTDLITDISFTAKSANIFVSNVFEETLGTTDASLYPEVTYLRSSKIDPISLNKLGGEAVSATVKIDLLKDQYAAVWSAGYSAEDFTHKISVDKSGNTTGIDNDCIYLSGTYDNLTVTALPELQCKNPESNGSVYYCYTCYEETGASAVTVLNFKHPLYNISFNYCDDGGEANNIQVSEYYTNSITLPSVVETEYVSNGLRYYVEAWNDGEKTASLEKLAITGDMTLNAVYSQGETATYSIEFYDYNGNLIGEGNNSYIHGSTVTAPVAGVDIPAERTDGNKEYTFAGWYPKFSETATKDVKYHAVYTMYDNDYSYVNGKSAMDELVGIDMTDRKCNYILQKLEEFLSYYNNAAALNENSDIYKALYPEGIDKYTEYVNYLKGSMAAEIYKNLSDIKAYYDYGGSVRYYNFEYIIANFENMGINPVQLENILNSMPVYEPGELYPEFKDIEALYESCVSYYQEAISFKSGLANLENDCAANSGNIWEYLFRQRNSEYTEYGWESSLSNIDFDIFHEILTTDDGKLDREAVNELLEFAVSDIDRLLDSELLASFINSITMKDGDTVGALGVWNYDYVYKNTDGTTERVKAGDECKTVREFIISKTVDCLWGGAIQTKLFRVMNEAIGPSVYNYAGSYFDIKIAKRDGWQWLPEILHLGFPTMPHDYVENWLNPLTGDSNVQFGTVSDYTVDRYKYFTGEAFGYSGMPEYDYTDILQVLDKAPLDKTLGVGTEVRSYWKPFTYGEISNEDRSEYKPGDVISERQALDAGLWEGTTPIYYQNSYGDKNAELAPGYEPVYFDSKAAWHINDWSDFFRTFAVATSGFHVPIAELLTCKSTVMGSTSSQYGETDILALDTVIESIAVGDAFYDEFFVPFYRVLGITQEYDEVNNPGGYRSKEDIFAVAGTYATNNNKGVNCSSIYNSGETLSEYLLQPVIYWLENELFVRPAETILELIPNLIAEMEYDKLLSKLEDNIIKIESTIKPLGISITLSITDINIEDLLLGLVEGFGFSKDILNGGLVPILTSLVSATRTTTAPTEQELKDGKYLMKVKNQSIVDNFGNVTTTKQVSKTEAAVWVDSEGNSYYLKDIGILTQWLYKLFWKDNPDTVADESLNNGFLDYFAWFGDKNSLPHSIPVNFIMAAGSFKQYLVSGFTSIVVNYYIEAEKSSLLLELIRYFCDVQLYEDTEKLIDSLLTDREYYGLAAVLAKESENLMKVVHLVNENVFKYDGKGFTVNFYDSQDKLFNVQIVPVGEAAQIPAFIPKKQSNATYHYTFSGFDKSIDSIVSDMDVTALYTEAEHIFDSGVVLSDTTCTQDGQRIYSCSVESCDYSRSETIGMLGHNLIKVEAVDAGCTTNGNVEHYRCERCKKLFSDESASEELTEKQSIIPAKGHNLVDGVCQCCGADSIIGSGICNGDIRWAFDLEKYTLIISGVGNMKNFHSSKLAPWDIYKDQITHIIVEEGITGIGNLSFYRLAKVIDVSLPTTLLSIGNHAFNGCAELSEITIPASVNKIGTKAFHACSKLSAFTVSEENMNYTVLDGVLFSKDMTTLVKYPDFKEAESYVIPETVVKLGEYSFSGCQYLTEIDGLGNVSVIETGAFSESFELTQFSLNGNVTKISPYAFYGCIGLESVSFTDSVKEIGDWAFYGCDSLKEVNFTGSEEVWISYGLDQANESLMNANVAFVTETIEQISGETATANLLTFALRKYAEPSENECTHVLGELEIIVPSGCEVSGTGQRNCELCDYFETEEIAATGHADDSADGICDNCGFDFAENCACPCHLEGIISFLWKLISFIKNIFGMSHLCPCGLVL